MPNPNPNIAQPPNQPESFLQDNTLRLTIAANVDLSARAAITLSGLAGAGGTDGRLAILDTDYDHAQYFSSAANRSDESYGLWDDSAKTLTLFVNTLIRGGAAVAPVYELGFTVVNPLLAQDRPTITIQSRVSVELIDVVYPGTGFVAGDVGVVGGAGSGFAAVFGVDSTGGIAEVNISGNGYGFLSRPDAVAYYPATQLEAAAAEDDDSLSISAAGLGASGLAAEVEMQLLVGDEVVTVASVGAASVTVTRGDVNTTATTHAAGTLVSIYPPEMLNSITQVVVDYGGSNYTAGDIVLRDAEGGSGFLASFSEVDADGAILRSGVRLARHGQGYTNDPGISLVYPGTNQEQTNSLVTLISQNAGTGYVPGVVLASGGNGTDFLSYFNVTLGGETLSDDISAELATDRGKVLAFDYVSHGIGYTEDPTVDVYHFGMDVRMTHSITEVSRPRIAGVVNTGCVAFEDTLAAIGGGGSAFRSLVNQVNCLSPFATLPLVPDCITFLLLLLLQFSSTALFLFQVSGEALRVDAPGFYVRGIGHTTARPLEQNTITVTLVSNTRLNGADESKITIKNLVGTTTSDTSGIMITDIECNSVIQQCPSKAIENATALWTQLTGTLVLPVAQDQSIEVGVRYLFSFNLQNSGVAQAAPAVTIEASGSATFPEQLMVHDTNSELSALVNPIGGANALEVETAAFQLRRVGQTTPLPGASNTVTFTLVSNVALSGAMTNQESAILITGIEDVDIAGPCSSQTALCRVNISGADAGRFTSDPDNPDDDMLSGTALYNRSSSQLFLFLREAFPVDTLVVFAVQITNSPASQPAAVVTVAAQNGETPLMQLASVAMIADTNPPLGAYSTLSQDVTASASDVFISVASVAPFSVGGYVLIGSEAMLVLASDTASRTLRVDRAQKGSALSAHVAVVTEVKRRQDGSFGHNTVTTAMRVWAVMPSMTFGDAAPGFVRSVQFETARVGQSTPYPGAKNLITVTLSISLPLATNTAISIIGLSGASAKNSSNLVIFGPSATRLSGQPGGAASRALWDNIGKTLVVYLREAVALGEILRFSFPILNPTRAQPSQSPKVGIMTASSSLAAALPRPPSTWLFAAVSSADTQISVVSPQDAALGIGDLVRVGTELMRVTALPITHVTATFSASAANFSVLDAAGAGIVPGTMVPHLPPCHIDLPAPAARSQARNAPGARS